MSGCCKERWPGAGTALREAGTLWERLNRAVVKRDSQREEVAGGRTTQGAGLGWRKEKFWVHRTLLLEASLLRALNCTV